MSLWPTTMVTYSWRINGLQNKNIQNYQECQVRNYGAQNSEKRSDSGKTVSFIRPNRVHPLTILQPSNLSC